MRGDAAEAPTGRGSRAPLRTPALPQQDKPCGRRHVEPCPWLPLRAAEERDGRTGRPCGAAAVPDPIGPTGEASPRSLTVRRPAPRLALQGTQQPPGAAAPPSSAGRGAAPSRCPEPPATGGHGGRVSRGSSSRPAVGTLPATFPVGSPAELPAPHAPLRHGHSRTQERKNRQKPLRPFRTGVSLPSYLPGSRRLRAARSAPSAPRGAQVALGARFPRAARPRRPAHPPPSAAGRRALHTHPPAPPHLCPGSRAASFSRAPRVGGGAPGPLAPRPPPDRPAPPPPPAPCGRRTRGTLAPPPAAPRASAHWPARR